MSGYCDDCGNTLCICDWETREGTPLRSRIKSLEAKLSVAVECLEEIANGGCAKLCLPEHCTCHVDEAEAALSKIRSEG